MWKLTRESKRRSMRGQGLLPPNSKLRVDHILDASDTPGKQRLKTAYNLTKGGKLTWGPEDYKKVHPTLPTLEGADKDAIRKGMKNYYDVMMDMGSGEKDPTPHLRKVGSYLANERAAREARLRQIERTERDPDTDKNLLAMARHIVEAELEAVQSAEKEVCNKLDQKGS